MRALLLTLLCALLTAQTTTPPSTSKQVPSTIGRPGESAPVTVEKSARPSSPSPWQAPQTPPPSQGEEQDDAGLRIRTFVDEVIAPVLVFNKDGGYVSNIRKDQFRLFDNDEEQNINVEETFHPISLVVLVQANAHVEGLLPHVNKIGSLIGPQVIGDAGEAALIAFDHRIRVLQDFTTHKERLNDAIKTIKPGSSSSRMVDAVSTATRMLRNRPRERRRIILLLGETRDYGSEARTRDTLLDLQFNNVMFYAVDMSRFMTTLTAPPQPSRPDPYLPSMRGPLPLGVPSTPTTMQQTYGVNARAEFVPLFIEIFRDALAIFKSNPVEVFTKATGGSEFGFRSQRTLESAITEIGEQLHSQYMISYAPNNRDAFGFHEIKVVVVGRREVDKIVTRPGYWMGPPQK